MKNYILICIDKTLPIMVKNNDISYDHLVSKYIKIHKKFGSQQNVTLISYKNDYDQQEKIINLLRKDIFFYQSMVMTKSLILRTKFKELENITYSLYDYLSFYFGSIEQDIANSNPTLKITLYRGENLSRTLEQTDGVAKTSFYKEYIVNFNLNGITQTHCKILLFGKELNNVDLYTL
jgi:hypothetical protein